VHESCVHGVPNGALVEKDGLTVSLNGSVIATYTPCQYAPFRPSAAAEVSQERFHPEFTNTLSDGGACYNQAVTSPEPYAQYNTQTDSNGFGALQEDIFVPDTPSVDNATEFFWQGLTWTGGDSYSGIMQAVVQYGASAAGGSAGDWYMGTWAVLPSNTLQSASSWYYSELVSVAAEDEIWTSVYMLNPSVSDIYGLYMEDISDSTPYPYTQQAFDPGTYVIPTAWPAVFEVGGTATQYGGICACDQAPTVWGYENIHLGEYGTDDTITFDTSTYVDVIGNYIYGCGWTAYEEDSPQQAALFWP
jgi:hypothetical protein